MATKNHILGEIRRTAEKNGGVPLGRQRFYAETGIKESDWLGRYWARWSDPTRFKALTARMLSWNGSLRSQGRLVASLRGLRSSSRPKATRPSRTRKRSSASAGRVSWRTGLAKYCAGRLGYEDVIASCKAVPRDTPATPETSESAPDAFGYVYLLKSGRYYKLGRSNAVGRRERELAIQLPERAAVVHSIKTDDPVGIEFYWHRRFEERRRNGEWFELTARDVAAFKRRRFM